MYSVHYVQINFTNDWIMWPSNNKQINPTFQKQAMFNIMLKKVEKYLIIRGII
jgi:hypothetical protein